MLSPGGSLLPVTETINCNRGKAMLAPFGGSSAHSPGPIALGCGESVTDLGASWELTIDKIPSRLRKEE